MSAKIIYNNAVKKIKSISIAESSFRTDYIRYQDKQEKKINQETIISEDKDTC